MNKKNYKDFLGRLTCSEGKPGQHRDVLQHGLQPKIQPAIIETTHKTEFNHFNDFASNNYSNIFKKKSYRKIKMLRPLIVQGLQACRLGEILTPRCRGLLQPSHQRISSWQLNQSMNQLKWKRTIRILWYTRRFKGLDKVSYQTYKCI